MIGQLEATLQREAGEHWSVFVEWLAFPSTVHGFRMFARCPDCGKLWPHRVACGDAVVCYHQDGSRHFAPVDYQRTEKLPLPMSEYGLRKLREFFRGIASAPYPETSASQ